MKSNISIYSMLFIFIVFTFSSCEKDITVDLPRAEPKIVVSGEIEIDQYPIVFLTKSFSYFDKIDTTYVQNLIISDDQATVIVTHGNETDTLIPQTFDIWPYKGYIGTKIKGRTSNIPFNLKIIHDGNEYFSQTRILEPISIDTVWYENVLGRDTIGTLTMNWKNPPGYGDYFAVTIKMSTQKWFFRSFLVHVLDDKLLETNEVIDCPLITKGYQRNSFFPSDSDDYEFADIIFFKTGDTVSLKLSTIDENSYLFWNSWSRNKATDGNPFTNPATVKSNITGAPANGSWIGYGSYIKTYFIDEEHKVILLDK